MLRIIPIAFRDAADYVERNHRHNKAPVGHKFSIGVAEDAVLHGVAIVGRPVSRHLDDGMTLEVYRCCTDGTRNACSILYGYAWKAAKAMGYTRLITYTRRSEPGTSLRASGWRFDGEAGGTHWTGKRYAGRQTQPDELKYRWVKEVSV